MAAPLRKTDLLKLSEKELIKKYKVNPKWKETKSDLVDRILRKNGDNNQIQRKQISSKAQKMKQRNNKTKSIPPMLLSQSSTDFTVFDVVKLRQSNDEYKNNYKSRNRKDKSTQMEKNKSKKKKNKGKNKKKGKHKKQYKLSAQHKPKSPLPTIYQDKVNENQYQNQTFPELVNKLSNRPHKHSRNSSIIEIYLQAPKKQYKISGIRLFNTVKEIKSGLPLKNIESTQCKLFYGGKELNDSQTLSELHANTTYGYAYNCGFKFKLKISWRHFKPSSKQPHPKEMEHEHYDKVAEMKKINNFKTFNALIGGLLGEYGINIKTIPADTQHILHGYCMCLSGDKTYEQRWTKLHSLCYDYQNDIGVMVDLLKQHNIYNTGNEEKQNLYIDAWPHSGKDTPLRMAINRAIPNKNEDKKVNDVNAKGAVELVQFFVLNGARRMIRPTVVNLERTVNDQLYIGMDIKIRKQLIKILKVYIDEDPYKPIQNKSK